MVFDPVSEPASAPPSVTLSAVNAVAAVNTTLATPALFVVDVGVAKEPPAPLELHVTTRPAVGTATPLASLRCAVTVTPPPTTNVSTPVVTKYFAGVPGVTLIDCVTVLVAPS